MCRLFPFTSTPHVSYRSDNAATLRLNLHYSEGDR